jgi:hypothetical protein
MEKLLIILGGVALIVIISLLMGFPIKWLWNWLMPNIFSLKEISFWQAVGLNLFAGIIFNRVTTSK